MTRYKCTISYDGHGFSGYQVQPNKRTVQSELEKALGKIHKIEVPVTASGRTDAGVHAYGQVIHFDSYLSMEPWQLTKAMNSLLPDDIAVRKIELVDSDFHARFGVEYKEYRYKVDNGNEINLFARNYSTYYPGNLHIENMIKASKTLIGEHDFSSFCAANTSVVDKVRTIKDIKIVCEGNIIEFRFVGNGFLYNMVRILVGTLLEVGNGKKSVEEIKDILEKKNRKFAGKTAPPNGLYLWQVTYKEF